MPGERRCMHVCVFVCLQVHTEERRRRRRRTCARWEWEWRLWTRKCTWGEINKGSPSWGRVPTRPLPTELRPQTNTEVLMSDRCVIRLRPRELEPGRQTEHAAIQRVRYKGERTNLTWNTVCPSESQIHSNSSFSLRLLNMLLSLLMCQFYLRAGQRENSSSTEEHCWSEGCVMICCLNERNENVSSFLVFVTLCGQHT